MTLVRKYDFYFLFGWILYEPPVHDILRILFKILRALRVLYSLPVFQICTSLEEESICDMIIMISIVVSIVSFKKN